ncbi:MAG: hypothetical protein HY809_09645 [Nitrospirae bacterium]|nr:hypothetical protein [Nitrospirota bacterium]
MSECFTRSLFGVNKPYVTDISPGDFCYLYNYSDQILYGVWKATTTCACHEPKAWGGHFKLQVRVQLISKTMLSIPFHQIRPLINLGDDVTWKLFNVRAHDLYEHFASEYASEIEVGRKLQKYDEDYRNKYPANFRCEDGHKVRSLSEQTIDNWLFHHKVIHTVEPIVPIPEKLIPDFMVETINGENIFIEFWGMLDDPLYKERMYKKFKIYADRRLPLIEIRPEHLQNLDFELSNKLKQKNVNFR